LLAAAWIIFRQRRSVLGYVPPGADLERMSSMYAVREEIRCDLDWDSYPADLCYHFLKEYSMNTMMQAIGNPKWRVVLAVLAFGSLMANPATAQFATGFEAAEGYVGSATGTPVTGQNGWYTISNDQFVFTYGGNALGFPQNPTGGDQFIGSRATGNGDFARAIQDIDFSQGGVWTLACDICAATSNGRLPNNLSSFSLNDFNVARSFIALNLWQREPGAVGKWRMCWEVSDAPGLVTAIVKPPPVAFKHLQQNHWYRQSTVVDFNQNKIVQVAVTDLSTLVTTTFSPTTWYLQGGASGGGRPLPTGIRFFTGGRGGNNPANLMGWDNVSITPGMAPGIRGGKVVNFVSPTAPMKMGIFPFPVH
jgi:hypothetical protein